MAILVQTPAPLAPGVPIPASAVPQLAQATPSVEALRAQLADLAVQRAGYRAQWTALQSQLNSMRLDNPARPAVSAKWSEVGVQIAQTDGDIARLQAQIQQRTGTSGTSIPGVPPHRSPDPDMVFGLSFLVLLALIVPISIGFGRRLWRGHPALSQSPQAPVSAQRFERLEQAVDSIAIEIERISEGQRFVTKVLTERMPIVKPSVAEAADPQPKALGAAPMEPIRVAERQAVRVSITPH